MQRSCICRNPPGHWQFVFRSNANRTRTEPTVLMAEDSTALHAYMTGQPCFFPSKKRASLGNRYRFGPNESLDGSIYCYPIKVPTSQGELSFVITFATYGMCLCEEYNTQASEAFSLIFREFSRRIELELVLWTIKGFEKPSDSAKVVKRDEGGEIDIERFL